MISEGDIEAAGGATRAQLNVVSGGNTPGQKTARLTAAAGLRANTPAILAETPSVSISGTVLSGGVYYYTWDTTNNRPNPDIGFVDYPRENIILYGGSYPQTQFASGAGAYASTGAMWMTTATDYFGAACDVLLYGNGFGSRIWIDDVFFGNITPAFRTGTAQAGAAGTITLDSGASATNGYYNEYYVVITGGTGVLGEVRRITGYVGSTKVATVSANWTTNPDNTTTFAVVENERGLYCEGITGYLSYVHLTWTKPRKSRIRVAGSNFVGFAIDPNDTIAPAPAPSGLPLLVVGDSFWEGAASPSSDPILAQQVAEHIGCNLVNLSSGGTGACNPPTGSGSANRFSFVDRICPPAEAWIVSNIISTVSGGTFTITVTTSAGTQTTGNLAYNATSTTIENALNALTNVTAISGANFAVGRGDFGSSRIYIARNMPGATISFDSTNLTGGGALSIVGNYLGDVEMNRPKDADGNGLPFILLVPGSGNDSAQSDATVQAAMERIAAKAATWPTCITIFTGVVGDAGSSSDTITAPMISRNAAIRAAAMLLPKINGQVAYIDTYDAGLNGKVWLYGSGTIGAPTNNTRSAFKSVTNAGHPTGRGAGLLASIFAARLSALLRLGATWPA